VALQQKNSEKWMPESCVNSKEFLSHRPSFSGVIWFHCVS